MHEKEKNTPLVCNIAAPWELVPLLWRSKVKPEEANYDARATPAKLTRSEVLLKWQHEIQVPVFTKVIASARPGIISIALNCLSLQHDTFLTHAEDSPGRQSTWDCPRCERCVGFE